jgi:hypothetical protein
MKLKYLFIRSNSHKAISLKRAIIGCMHLLAMGLNFWTVTIIRYDDFSYLMLIA